MCVTFVRWVMNVMQVAQMMCVMNVMSVTNMLCVIYFVGCGWYEWRQPHEWCKWCEPCMLHGWRWLISAMPLTLVTPLKCDAWHFKLQVMHTVYEMGVILVTPVMRVTRVTQMTSLIPNDNVTHHYFAVVLFCQTLKMQKWFAVLDQGQVTPRNNNEEINFYEIRHQCYKEIVNKV